MTLQEIVAANLENWRQQMGLSQVQASAVIGISQPNWSRMLNGKHDFRVSSIERYAKKMGVDASSLLERPKKVKK